MIQVESVTYRYPQSDVPALEDFSARFRRGEINAIRGRNGCGKTTLTKLLVGVLRPASGYITIDGDGIAGMDLFEIGKKAGYVFQNPNRQLFCDTVFNEVAFGLRNAGFNEAETERVTAVYLERFGLERYSGVYPGKLSFGEKQRLALAAVLALGTSFVVLDEPTSGLDVSRRAELADILLRLKQEHGCGVIFASHDTGFIARCADRELVIER